MSAVQEQLRGSRQGLWEHLKLFSLASRVQHAHQQTQKLGLPEAGETQGLQPRQQRRQQQRRKPQQRLSLSS
jgi:hypothetical protein